jgi:hypothetical protein
MPSHQPDRRQFLASAALGTTALLPGYSLAQNAANLGKPVAPPASNKKVAAIVTTYYRYSHADNIVTRFMEGYSIVGKSYPPPCTVAGLYIDQSTDLDIGQPLAKRWGVPLYKSIAECLTLGGSKLAVDGVVLVAEHGDYPVNDKGQRLYPRRQFFEEIVKVFRASGKSVPVFNDKHLSYSWDNAKWMYDQSRELSFPFLAGSSVPVTWRRPDLQPPSGVEWEKALSLGYGHFEVYGFHTLEALQVMAERRKGGETGVQAVRSYEGPAVWDAAAAGKWDRALLDAALAKAPGNRSGKIEDVDADALLYEIEYRDGFRAASYMSTKFAREFAFAGRIKGHKEPAACWYDLPKPQRDHFSFLTQHAANMIITGKAPYPVERTLLTTGMLAALMDSKAAGGKRIETPWLDVSYKV